MSLPPPHLQPRWLTTRPGLRFVREMPRSLAEEAYELLVRKITRLEAEPGSVLVEKDLMAEFGIGRTPLREAMQRLAIERLVNHQPNRGMFVSEINATSVQQIYEFRAILDGHAAWLAANRATSDQIEELRAWQEELVRATEEGDIDAYVDADRQFYRVLGEAAHNAWLADSIPRIFNVHLRLWFFISRRVGSWEGIARAHEVMTRDVVAALSWRDAAKAKAAMEAYVAGRLNDIKGIL
jgi:GntR family transcriptional regulator, rspAB operon transcriptional repressor